ncbi:hypothetical protein P280DRAFT_482086 [Massarina eburnea CBS 473.64]|uniref:Aminoglycoside phosphotransferase domain-containing protein n=1 Tax=Massarina eburnea CBS 473.64 TaxID=1395130 RepID=A0A6A6RVC8_9PLEO|nr:hypothetical protein P280DRAFT_482086 [Massarina eburnea CBS 473.64]
MCSWNIVKSIFKNWICLDKYRNPLVEAKIYSADLRESDIRYPRYDELSEDEIDFQQRWGLLLAIPDEAFFELSKRVFGSATAGTSEKYAVEDRTQGALHHFVIMNNGMSRFVIKTPVVGTRDRWKQEHGAILRSEAHTMMHIKNTLPISDPQGLQLPRKL